MADLSANSAGSVSVAIGADLGPLQTALAKAEQIVRAFDARMSAASGGAGLLGGSAQAAQQAAAAMDKIAAPAAAAQAQIAKVATAATAASGATDLLAKASAGGTISAAAMAKALEATGGNLAKITPEMLGMAEAAGAASAATARLAPAAAAGTTAVAELGAAEVRTTAMTAGVTREFTILGAEIARGNLSRIPSSLLVLNERLISTGTGVLTLKNAMGALGGLASVVFNPYVLGFLAITLGLDAAIRGFDALTGSGKTLADVLKDQKDYVESLADAYPRAAKAAEAYQKAASGPTPAQGTQQGFQSIADLENQAAKARASIESLLRNAMNPAGNGPDLAAQYRDANTALGDLSGKFRGLLQDFVAGKTTAAELSTELANLYINPSLSQTARNNIILFEAQADSIVKAKVGIDANTIAISQLTGAYQQLVLAANNRKTELEATDDVTKSLQFQIATMGQSNAAVAAAKEYQSVWNAGIEAGATDLRELAAQAASAAGQVAGLTSSLAAAQAHSDLTFSLSMIGMSPAQQKAAGQLRGGQTNASAVLAGPGGNDAVLNSQLTEFLALTKKADPAAKTAKADLDALTKSGVLTADQVAILNKRLVDFGANTGSGHRAANAFQTSLDSLAKQTAALNAQANSYGLSTAQMESNVKAQELITQAQNAHVALSPKVLAAINAEASAYGAAAQAAKLAAVNDNANFALRTLGMNATDAGIAQTLKGAVGGDWPAYMNSSTAQTLRFAAAMSDLKQSAEDASNTFASTFLSDLKQGDTLMQSFADAASQALDQIANKLISMAMDNLWSNAFGGSSGGGIFSFLGGLFGGGSTALAPGAGLSWASAAFPAFASGTNSAPGGVALVGENGPELMNVPRGAQIIPAPQTRGLLAANSNGGSVTITMGDTYVNGSGLSAEELGAVLAANNQKLLDGLNQQIVPVVQRITGTSLSMAGQRRTHFRAA